MDEAIPKPLPHNPEAERAVLGSAWVQPDSFINVIPQLRAGHFFLSPHRVIYTAMQSLIASEQPINTITLMELLGRLGKLEAAGGVAYLEELADRFPRTSHVEHYARIVRAKAQRREILTFAEDLKTKAWEDGESFDSDDEAADLIDSSITHLLMIGSDNERSGKCRPWNAVAKSAVDELLSAKLNPDRGGRMKFGIKKLDAVLGGLKRKEVCVIVAPTSSGKSQIASQLSVQSSRDGFKVLYFSAEMPGEQIVLRELSYRAGVKFFYARLANAASEPVSLQIVDQDITPARVWAMSEAAKRTVGLDLAGGL